MKYLYVFPHPDDESFGPAAGMHQQLRQGHEVHLLTLTKGGATQQRNRLGLSIEEMGEVRYQEMLAVQHTLGLSSMTVLDLPDSGLKHMDPREIEEVVCYQIERLRPDILVSYPVHGISGFHDHLVMHAVIKRLWVQMRDEGAGYLKRLAFFTVPDGGGPAIETNGFRFKQSQPEEIACILELGEDDIDAMKRALACYGTYQETIEQSGVVDLIGDRLHFELWGERPETVLKDLAEGLPPLT